MDARLHFTVYHLDDGFEAIEDFRGEVYAEDAGRLADIIRDGKRVEVTKIDGADANLVGDPLFIDDDDAGIFDEIADEARAFDKLSDEDKEEARRRVKEDDVTLCEALDGIHRKEW